MSTKAGKMERVLGIYSKLLQGNTIFKFEEANRYGVNERSIERDIEDIRNYFEDDSEGNYHNSVIYDKDIGGYVLERSLINKFSKGEVLAICKILLDSRAFPKDIMLSIIERIINNTVDETVGKKEIIELIKNEEFHYVSLRNNTNFIERLWTIGSAIRQHKKIKIEYKKLSQQQTVERIIRPLSIMFSEYYFYLIAFIDDISSIEKELNYDTVSPTIYRVDRILDIDVLDEKFCVPYSKRFQEGEFRKRVQFMFGGRLRKVTFCYLGKSIESILDRLPTARIISESDGVYVVEAEVYGDGIDMWINSQGEMISDVKIK